LSTGARGNLFALVAETNVTTRNMLTGFQRSLERFVEERIQLMEEGKLSKIELSFTISKE
jgi:hypothetical protein